MESMQIEVFFFHFFHVTVKTASIPPNILKAFPAATLESIRRRLYDKIGLVTFKSPVLAFRSMISCSLSVEIKLFKFTLK